MGEEEGKRERLTSPFRVPSVDTQRKKGPLCLHTNTGGLKPVPLCLALEKDLHFLSANLTAYTRKIADGPDQVG